MYLDSNVAVDTPMRHWRLCGRLVLAAASIFAAAVTGQSLRPVLATRAAPLDVAFPGVSALLPHSFEVFRFPLGCPGPCATPRGIRIENRGDELAAGAYDGTTLTLTAQLGYAITSVSGCDATPVPALVVACQVSPGLPLADIAFELAGFAIPELPPQEITYATGWNLIGLPAGTLAAETVGPLYTPRSAGEGYEVLPAGAALEAGRGYWAYFDRPTTLQLAEVGPVSARLQLPAGRWALVGNPGQAPVAVIGLAIVVIYDEAAQAFTYSLLIPPGHGAWVYPLQEGTFTLSSGLP